MTLYCSPRARTGKRRGTEGSGLYPELAAYRISEGNSPNVQAEVGRLVGLLPIEQARAELARKGLEEDEKAVRRIAGELGAQMLATRTRDLMRFRAGELPAGKEFAGKSVAAEIDGGRVRVRTIVEKIRVSGKMKRKKFRVEWREPKVVILYWIVAQVKLDPCRVVEVLDWCHAVHHVSVALAALSLAECQRKELYNRLRATLKEGKSHVVIKELEALAVGEDKDSSVWREIRYLTKHSDAGRLRYNCFRCRGVPMGSGAIESTIRRVINLRLKGNGIYWTEDNAEAVFQLRAAVVSGRWDEILTHTQDAMARDRRTDWRWTPPECLAELKALEDEDEELTQTSTKKQSKRTAA